MLPDPSVESLLAQYVERLLAGRDRLEPARLCADRPELIEPLRAAIARYEELAQELSDSGVDSALLAAARRLGLSSAGAGPEDASTRLFPPALRPAPGDVLAGRYRIHSLLGRGGMGEVYRARDPRLERDVALKVLRAEVGDDPELLRRFEREAKSLAALAHPNIVTVYSVEEADGVRFLTMELVAGRTLAELIPSGGMRLDRFFAVALQLADAVATAHARGVLHRDLKPANVMVTEDGRVKVLDFGLAKPVAAGAETASATLPDETLEELTRAGQLIGTVPYMAPERLKGRPATRCSDIFSLGAILHQMVTGERPFAGDGDAELVSSILRDRPPPVAEIRPGLPRQLGRIVSRCLSKKPRRRFQTARDVHSELEQLREEVTSSPAARANSPRGRRSFTARAAVAAATIVVLALAAWAFVTWRGPGEREPGGAASSIRSLVTLPATVHGPEDDAYLADAVPATLSTHLTEIEGMETKVPPRAAELARETLDSERVAELYGVDALVVPAVTVEAGNVVLTLQLVQAADRRLLWSKQYRGSRDGYIEVVERAAAELRRELRPGEGTRPSVAGLTASSPAELAFRRGQYFSNRFNHMRHPGDAERARDALQEALAIDPGMAEAAAEMGWLRYLQLEEGDSAMLDELEQWARKALEIDRGTSLAWTDLSMAAWFRADHSAALRHALQGTAAGPSDARAHIVLALQLFGSGLPDLSCRAADESVRLDPLYLRARGIWAACVQLTLGPQRALEIVEETLELEPSDVLSRDLRTWFLLRLGRLQEAREGLGEGTGGRFSESLREVFRVDLALQAGTAGPRETGDALIRILREARTPYLGWFVTVASEELAARDEGEVLFDILDEVERRSRRPPAYPFLLELSAVPSLRERPGFEGMLARSRSDYEDVLESLVEADRQGNLPDYLGLPLRRAHANAAQQAVAADGDTAS